MKVELEIHGKGEAARSANLSVQSNDLRIWFNIVYIPLPLSQCFTRGFNLKTIGTLH
jgi:hypothetical protein